MFDLVFKTALILGLFSLPIAQAKFPNNCYMGTAHSFKSMSVRSIADACILRINLNTMFSYVLFHADRHHHLGQKVTSRNQWHEDNTYNCGIWTDEQNYESWVICSCYTDLCNKPIPFDDLVNSGKNITFKTIPTPDVTDFFA